MFSSAWPLAALPVITAALCELEARTLDLKASSAELEAAGR